ncbi:hypothetical protein HWV62_9295 [Athelia sp. TMB]|nr:hypothetical protein HWV62_9295 [Athelia sp. TMB]
MSQKRKRCPEPLPEDYFASFPDLQSTCVNDEHLNTVVETDITDIASEDLTDIAEDDATFFAKLNNRRMNTLNTRYSLPVDDIEAKRSKIHHRLINSLLGGRNYVGPVRDILDNPESREAQKILDMGAGEGRWALDMANEFPQAEIIAVDLAPTNIQNTDIPANCSFQVCDLDQRNLPFASGEFDVVHARSIHYRRPGGIVILVEADTEPIMDSEFTSNIPRTTLNATIPGWYKLWFTYRRCLEAKEIDIDVPRQMRALLERANGFTNIVTQHIDVPVGFWPSSDPQLLIGQLAWKEYDLLLPGMAPLLIEKSSKTDSAVKKLIQDAQYDLHYPKEKIYSRIHIAHAIKKVPYRHYITRRPKKRKLNT